MEYELHCGDCLEIMPTLGKVDAVITDPPYGVAWDADYTRFTGNAPNKTWMQIANDEKPFDPTPWLAFPVVVLFGANCFSNKLPMGSWLIWDKRFFNGEAFLADGEAAWMNKGHGIYIKSVTQQGFVRPEQRYHPTQKPRAVMEWIIEKATKPGDLILDPFMGSGSTGIAAMLTGRRFIGIELDPGYFAIAQQRIEDAARQARGEFKHVTDNQTHDDLPLFAGA